MLVNSKRMYLVCQCETNKVKYPQFNTEGDPNGKYCSRCKRAGMINVVRGRTQVIKDAINGTELKIKATEVRDYLREQEFKPALENKSRLYRYFNVSEIAIFMAGVIDRTLQKALVKQKILKTGDFDDSTVRRFFPVTIAQYSSERQMYVLETIQKTVVQMLTQAKKAQEHRGIDTKLILLEDVVYSSECILSSDVHNYGRRAYLEYLQRFG